MWKPALGLPLAAMLQGCMTVYAPMGPRGGYYAIPRTGGQVDVVIASNGARNHATLEAWLMHRCAVVTLESGKEYFRVVDKGDQPFQTREHAEYVSATIQMLDSADGDDVYEAAAVRASTVGYLVGPTRYH